MDGSLLPDCGSLVPDCGSLVPDFGVSFRIWSNYYWFHKFTFRISAFRSVFSIFVPDFMKSSGIPDHFSRHPHIFRDSYNSFRFSGNPEDFIKSGRFSLILVPFSKILVPFSKIWFRISKLTFRFLFSKTPNDTLKTPNVICYDTG